MKRVIIYCISIFLHNTLLHYICYIKFYSGETHLKLNKNINMSSISFYETLSEAFLIDIKKFF